MLPKATLLALVALVANVAAVPVKAPAGISIPLHKRGSLTTAEGVFDHAKAIRASVMTQNKYRRNLMTLKSNGEEPTSIPSEFAKRQSELLEEHGSEWSGSISIGTPPQNFLIAFDTTSSDLWVASVDCKDDGCDCRDAGCDKKTKFNPSISSTSHRQDGNFSLNFRSFSTVEGPVFTDTVDVGGIRVTGQAFSPVTTMSQPLDEIDGILGLAFPALSKLHQGGTFFNTAIDQGALSQSVFGVKLAEEGSELFLGGANKKLFSGDLEFHKVDSSNGTWLIPGASLKVKGKTAAGSFKTVFDSGMNGMVGPAANVKAIYDTVGGQLFDAENGLFSFPCSSPPEIAFNWGGKDWAISPENINLGETLPASDICAGALSAGTTDGLFVLGDNFMRNMYTVFSFDDNAVGFAELA